MAVNWGKMAEMAPTQSQPGPLLAPLSLSSCHLDPFNSPFRPTDLHPLSQRSDGELTMVGSSSPLSSLCVLSGILLGPIAHSAEMMGQSHASLVRRSAWAQILWYPVLSLSVSLLFLRRSVYTEAE